MAADLDGDGNLWSWRSEDSVLSIGCKGSILSIGSAGSVLSIGSIGSVASLFSIGSLASVGSVMSGASRWSVMSWRMVRGLMAEPDPLVTVEERRAALGFLVRRGRPAG